MRVKINVQNVFSASAGEKILNIFFLLFAAVLSLRPAPLTAAETDWSAAERQMELEQRALEINEGDLQVLERPPEAASHHHQNRLLITAQSLSDGWVTMYQCHSDLDAVSATQVVYNKARIRNIKVLSSQNIGSVRIEGHTVQLKDVGAESEICISADKRALLYENGQYYLKLGPFMRRFLDGYYPMRVQVEVCYPTFLQLVGSSPVKAKQRSRNKTSYADIDIWIVGKLDIELIFRNTLSGHQ